MGSSVAIAVEQAVPHVRGYAFEPVDIGKSSCEVFRLLAPQKHPLFLKTARGVDAIGELTSERDCLVWLCERTLVPRVIDFVITEEDAFLLTSGLAGSNAAETPVHDWPRVVVQVAQALKTLHALEPGDCPFDRSLRWALPAARARVLAGKVDEDDFDEERRGTRAVELLSQLDADKPAFEDIVVTHGDACLPNFILDDGALTGFVDCGQCGLADRHYDLALAARSIEYNYGEKFVNLFFEAYGLELVDPTRLAYYRLVDEFF